MRSAGRGDLEHLLSLCEAYCLADGHPFDRARARGAFVPLLESDRYGTVWVTGTDPDVLLGYAVVTWGWSIESGGLDALLDEVYVRPRNEGLGTALMESIEADCRRRGCARLFLETERANDAARRFYRRRGFVVEDSIWMHLPL